MPLFVQITSVFFMIIMLWLYSNFVKESVDGRLPETLDKISLSFPMKAGFLMGISNLLKEYCHNSGMFSDLTNLFLDSLGLIIN